MVFIFGAYLVRCGCVSVFVSFSCVSFPFLSSSPRHVFVSLVPLFTVFGGIVDAIRRFREKGWTRGSIGVENLRCSDEVMCATSSPCATFGWWACVDEGCGLVVSSSSTMWGPLQVARVSYRVESRMHPSLNDRIRYPLIPRIRHLYISDSNVKKSQSFVESYVWRKVYKQCL